jgi:hypothetical protein
MGRDTVESHRKIELSWLKKQGYFPSGGGIKSGSIQWSQNGEPTSSIYLSVNTMDSFPKMTFNYRTQNHWQSDDEWKSMNYSFSLEKIPCRYGGFKWFVRCELSRGGYYCGARVRVLYSSSGYYGCRRCADLSYESCNESGRFRGGIFGFLSKQWKADEFLDTIPRKYYRGVPTRKYRKYLKMTSNYDEGKMMSALAEMNRLLSGKTRKKR